MARLAFNPIAHVYTLDGTPVPSVTQALKIVENFDSVPRAILENARDRGEQLHRAINLYNRDELDYDSLDDETRAGVHAWDRFINESGAVVIASEQPVYHETYRYAGTPDVVIEWNGRIAIPDVKSTYAVPRTVGAQTAAYAEAWKKEHRVKSVDRYCIHIKDGAYTTHKRTDSADWSLFLSCLNVTHFMEKYA